jgi:hypothetical protein
VYRNDDPTNEAVVSRLCKIIVSLLILAAPLLVVSCGDVGEKAHEKGTCDCTPPGGGALQPLEVGVAVTDLNVPIGISLIGFSHRKTPSHPLSYRMGASMGSFDRLQVKAVTLDNGQDRLVIVRVPLCVINDVLYARVIEEVCCRAGVDLTQKLWIGANHTHSGPGRYFPVPSLLAELGGDSWYQPAVDAMVDSMASAVIESMANLQPAAIAMGLDENFDSSDEITRDRRCEDDPPTYKENRLFVARIDTAEGQPLAVLLGFATHGTILQGWHYASDVMGWVEYMLQERYENPVEVLALVTSGGDQRPVYTKVAGRHNLTSLEILGNLVADKAQVILEQLSPTRDFTLEMVSRRILINREAIGYKQGEFGYYDPSTGVWRDFEMGAAGCGGHSMPEYGSIVDCNNPETSLIDGYLGHEVDLSIVKFWMQPWLYTNIAAIRLGTEVVLLFPGELTSHLATSAIEQAAQRYGLSQDRIHCFGYANDHQWYLLTEESWMQGGYETAVTMWGPKFGPWLADRVVELAGQLFTAHKEDNLQGALKPYTYEQSYTKSIQPEASDRTPRFLQQPSSSYKRFETVEVQWAGGFSGIDYPKVTMQRFDQNVFEDVLLPTGRIFTDQDFRTILEYYPEPDFDALEYPALRLHRWKFVWETTPEVETGLYRMQINGMWWDGQSEIPYTLTSETFTLSKCSRLEATDLAVDLVSETTYLITCRGWYPPVPGSYRLLNPEYAPDEFSPVESGSTTIHIEVAGGKNEHCILTWSPQDEIFTGTFVKTQTGLEHEAYVTIGSLQDEWLNSNTNELGPVVF